MELAWAVIIVVAVIIVWYMWQKNQCKEGLGGYGVTSALHFYDRIAYCDEGNGQSYGGGCFIPTKVII